MGKSPYGFSWSGTCPECGHFHNIKYGCDRPPWEIWCEEEGETREDASIYRDADAESAAIQWAEESDNGDYSIVNGLNEPIVCVAKKGDEKIYRFRVSGEAVAQYMTHEIRMEE